MFLLRWALEQSSRVFTVDLELCQGVLARTRRREGDEKWQFLSKAVYPYNLLC